MTLITLLTDFGRFDSYVAQMKGVILGMAPRATIVDATHEIPPGDIRLGALALDDMVDAFPPETIHVVVIDPGVGSRRALIGVEAAGQRFLAPDNGVLTEFLTRCAPRRLHQLTEVRFWRQPTSTTFHGRDILAPIAAHWVCGADLSEFGPPLAPERLIQLPAILPQREGATWRGEVVAVDHFGNLITNLRSDAIPELSRSNGIVTLGSHQIDGISRFYAERAPGSLVALIGSSNRLEVSVNGGSAARQLGIGRGATIRVTFMDALDSQTE